MLAWLQRCTRRAAALRSRRFTPRLEQLETRTPLAGNVTAVVAGGSLIVAGDNAGAAITVSQPSPAAITLTGNETTVNGRSGPVTFRGLKGDLQGGPVTFHRQVVIELGAGDDRLELGTGAKVRFKKPARLDGQAGNNVATVARSNLPALPRLKNFQVNQV